MSMKQINLKLFTFSFLTTVNALHMLISNATFNSSDYWFQDFIYPYQIYQNIHTLHTQPVYILHRIPASISTSNETASSLTLLPELIFIMRQKCMQKMELKKISPTTFLITESTANCTKSNCQRDAFRQNRPFLTDLLTDQRQKSEPPSQFQTQLNNKIKKSVYYYTLDINHYLLMTHYRSQLKQTKDSKNLSQLLICTQIFNFFRLQQKVELAYNGSSVRFLLFNPHNLKIKTKNTIIHIQNKYEYSLTIFDGGFKAQRNGLYQVKLPQDIFNKQIKFFKIFPLDAGLFYLIMVNQEHQVTLFQTFEDKVQLRGTMNMNNHHPHTFFYQIFTIYANHSFITYFAFLESKQLVFKAIISPQILAKIQTSQTQHITCGFSIQQNMISVQKISEQLVAICYDEADSVMCKIVNIFCEQKCKIKRIPNYMNRLWRVLENPVETNKKRVQLWVQNPIYSTSTLLIQKRQIDEGGTILEEDKQRVKPSIVEKYEQLEGQALLKDTKMIKEWQQTFLMKEQAYQNINMYNYIRGSKLLEKKLAPLLNQNKQQTKQEQEQNCKLILQNDKIVGVQFVSEKWSFCRLGIHVTNKNLILSADFQKIEKPYFVYKCGILSRSTTEECFYEQFELNKDINLMYSELNVLFIQNKGQNYNLSIKTLAQQEINRVSIIFFNICIITVITLAIVTLIVYFHPLITYLLILGGLYSGEPTFAFPLNSFERKIKEKIMMDRKLIRKKEATVEDGGDNCCFCLVNKLEGPKELIQFYCSHTFHQICFADWIRQERVELTCPICKRQLSEEGYEKYLHQKISESSRFKSEYDDIY